MIAFDFEYYKPFSVTEATETFRGAQKQGKTALFYSGGTEFITFARVNKLHADAVIDIKGLPECNVLELRGNQLVIGAGVSLNKITDSKLFPLLGQIVKQIADHTSRNKITLGGNINSALMYRESILPLLLVDANVKITKEQDEEIVALATVFDKKMKLKSGNMLLQIMIDKAYLDLPYVSLKRTKISKVGYPVVSVAALVKDNRVRIAFSGVCAYPFRSVAIEDIVNDVSLSIDERVDKVADHLPAAIVDDIQGSREYRRFVLKNALSDTLNELEVSK